MRRTWIYRSASAQRGDPLPHRPEVDALASAAVEGEHQAMDRALYLTAAMTGLRQGELLALRWQDVDWTAQRIRVRRSHVLGEFGTPKSRRGSRSVPMNKRVARELDRWHQATRWSADGALVFAEPATGEVLRARCAHAPLPASAEGGAAWSRRIASMTCAIRSAPRWPRAGVPMRTLQEWMGHRDFATTEIYADYVPNAEEVAMADRAFTSPLGPARTAELGPAGAHAST